MVSRIKRAAAKTALITVHISREEAMYFNYLQEQITGHEQDVDPETELRAYPALSEAIRQPHLRDVFIAVASLVRDHQGLPEPIDELSKGVDAQIKAKGLPPIPSDNEPDVQELAKTGQGKDLVMVRMPLDVVKFMDKIQGNIKRDPTMGLQEFWGFGNILKSVVRVAATVGGGLLGGPVGAAAGNTLGRMATGQNAKKAAIASLPNALYAYGAQQGLGAAGMGQVGPTNGLPQLHTMMGGGAGAAGAGTTAAANAAGPTAAQAAGSSSGISGLLGNQGLLGAGLMGAGMYMQHKADKDKEKRYDKDKAEYDAARKQAAHEHNSNRLSEPMMTLPALPMDYYKRQHRKKGGSVLAAPIVGRGKGQEDLINVDVPQNSWIDNATFVADVGDGSTKAGHKELEKLEKYIIKNHLKPDVVQQFKAEIKAQPLRNVPCALSDGERRKEPLLVAGFGQGSMKKGADVLRDIVTEVRKVKMSNGLKLPPACPDLITVYKRTAHKHGLQVR